MADFTTTITDAGVLDVDEVTIFEEAVIFAATPELVIDQAVTVVDQGQGKMFQFAVYDNLTAYTTALSDGADATSTAMADSSISITPAEQGNVITLARNADIQSGLKAGKAAGFLIGRNMGTTLDKLGILVAEAFSTTRIYPNAATAASNLATTDNLDAVFANRHYNKLARVNVPGIGGSYIGIAHDDCLHDLRVDTSDGGFIDVGRYADPQSVLQNEIGMFAGIRWLRSGNVTVTADSNGTIDSYKVNVIGFNGFGKAQSGPPELKVTGPFDKLGQFFGPFSVN
jgi:N4-gp56 family major capsid protein